MERRVLLCRPDCGCGCPSVEVTLSGVSIGEADNLVKLTAEEWNLLVEKIKSGELTTIEEMAADCECDCGC